MGARFIILDGMRGVAALIVACFHMDGLKDSSAFQASYLAVDFFFMLSGFVIASAYERSLESGRLSAAEFATVRLIRLWPLFVAGVLVGGAYMTLHALKDASAGSPIEMLAHTVTAIAFVPSAWIGPGEWMFPVNIPAWSLFFELLANFAYGLIAPHLSTRRLCWLVGAAVVWLIVQAVSLGTMDMGSEGLSLAGGAARVTFSFFAGVLIYRLPRPAPRKANVAALTLGLVLAAALVVGPDTPWFGLVAATVLFPTLVVLGSRYQPSARLGAICATLGAASYAFYILNVPISHWTLFVLNRLPGHVQLSAIAAGGLTIAVSFVAALMADRLWDQPLRRVLTAWLRPTAPVKLSIEPVSEAAP